MFKNDLSPGSKSGGTQLHVASILFIKNVSTEQSPSREADSRPAC
jgi:hypothetical protein